LAVSKSSANAVACCEWMCPSCCHIVPLLKSRNRKKRNWNARFIKTDLDVNLWAMVFKSGMAADYFENHIHGN
jgi:hypothetical protein